MSNHITIERKNPQMPMVKFLRTGQLFRGLSSGGVGASFSSLSAYMIVNDGKHYVDLGTGQSRKIDESNYNVNIERIFDPVTINPESKR